VSFEKLPLSSQKKIFFELWTQKEAIIKMRGGKLLTGLSRLIQQEATSEKKEYFLQPFYPFEGYVGTIACSG
jgi:phosphopantetheinyl transferase